MELYILDSSFKRESLVEGYESLLWAERFNEIGDFNFVMPNTASNKALFQPGLYFGLNKSDRIMKLETAEPATDDEGRKTLKLSGRSIEYILNGRVIWGSKVALGDNPEYSVSGTPANIITQTISAELITDTTASNNIPNCLTTSLYPTDTIAFPSETITVSIKTPTPLYEYVKDIAKTYSLGFRIYRGPDNGYVYYNTYAGSDRSTGQATLPPVLFSPDLDNIVNMSSIKSIEPTYSGCYVWSKLGYNTVYPEGYSTSFPAGLNRILFPIVVTEPEALTTSEQQAAYRIQKGQEALKARQDLFVLDGEIPQSIDYVYNQDYYLGDLVDVRDETGAINRMRVTEQIFTEDEAGERSYPTLEAETLIMPGTWAARSALETWPDAIGAWEDQ